MSFRVKTDEVPVSIQGDEPTSFSSGVNAEYVTPRKPIQNPKRIGVLPSRLREWILVGVILVGLLVLGNMNKPAVSDFSPTVQLEDLITQKPLEVPLIPQVQPVTTVLEVPEISPDQALAPPVLQPPPLISSASDGFEPTEVPGPSQAQITVTILPQPEVIPAVETELSTQQEPLASRATYTRLSGLENTQLLQSLRARGVQTGLVQVPFGYQYSETWLRWVLPSMYKNQVSGPYWITYAVTVDFARVTSSEDTISVPITGMEFESEDEGIDHSKGVILAVDENGIIAWPTQDDLRVYAPTTPGFGAESPWRPAPLTYWARLVDVKDVIIHSPDLVAKAFGIGSGLIQFAYNR